ncbi:MAG: recombinase RecT [Treponema sp.]|jgi:recombination protein RecT|nr:recombinase RecT [Treponema sp.]
METMISRGLFDPKEAAALERQYKAAIRQDPELAECTKDSFFGAMLTVVYLGLDVDKAVDQARLIPQWNEEEKRLECVFKLGGRGLFDLRLRCVGSRASLFDPKEEAALEAAFSGRK